MRSFLVSFKSNNQEDYSIVADRIRQTYDKWARIIDNVWIVNSDKGLSEIRSGISNIISVHNGIVLVVDIFACMCDAEAAPLLFERLPLTEACLFSCIVTLPV